MTASKAHTDGRMGNNAPPFGYGQPVAPPPPPQGEITERTAQILQGTKPWVQFLGVLCFVTVGLMLIQGLFSIYVFATMDSRVANGIPFPMTALFPLVYIFYSALYVYPGLKLWNYGRAIRTTLVSRRSGDLESALELQRSFFRFIGILIIVAMVLTVIVALIMAVVIGSHMLG